VWLRQPTVRPPISQAPVPISSTTGELDLAFLEVIQVGA
jgi:hypothetical protein